MAVRPLVTTGAALISAGALVAATPALFVPKDEIAIAAPSMATAPKQLTVDQVDLLALSLQGLYQAFFQGYGGYANPGTEEVTTYERNPDGTLVLDANGDPIPITTEEPVFGDCTATGAVCLSGFPGAAYYLSDELLPLGDVDNIFFESGIVPFFQIAAQTIAAEVDALDPTGRLMLERRVTDFFEGGATQLVGNTLLDNLSEGTVAYGLTNSFFFGYGENAGVVAALTYVVDAIAQGTADPVPNPINPLGPGVSSATVETQLVSKQAIEQKVVEGEDPASTNILTRSRFSVPVSGEAPGFKSDANTTPVLEKDGLGEETTSDGVAPAVNVTSPQSAALGQAPETPATAPEEPSAPAAEVKEETESTGATANTKDGNKFTPGVILSPGGRKSSSANGWEKLEQDVKKGINTLGKIFNKGKTSKPATSSTTDNAGEGGEGGGDE